MVTRDVAKKSEIFTVLTLQLPTLAHTNFNFRRDVRRPKGVIPAALEKPTVSTSDQTLGKAVLVYLQGLQW